MPNGSSVDFLTGRTWTRDRKQGGAGRPGVYVSSVLESVPGRGVREIFEFSNDGRFTMTGPGPDNRSRTTAGTWQVEEVYEGGAKLRLETEGNSTTLRVRQNDPATIVIEFE